MTMVRKYQAEVVAVDNPIDQIYVLTLRSLNRLFAYHPGQFLHLALDEYDPSGPWPESRCFSMQSNSAEETIRLTYAVKGKFTARMAQELVPGKIIWLKLPYGDLFGDFEPLQSSVFIAGGTGVTPFLSLFTDFRFSQYDKPRLYLGVRTRSYDLYASDLARATELNPNFAIERKYEDEAGILKIDEILQKCGQDAIYYVSGPPVMIRNFKSYLTGQGVLPDHVKTDDWE